MDNPTIFGLFIFLIAVFYLIRSCKDFKQGKIISRSKWNKQTVLTKQSNPRAFWLTLIIHISFQVTMMLYGIMLIIFEIIKKTKV